MAVEPTAPTTSASSADSAGSTGSAGRPRPVEHPDTVADAAATGSVFHQQHYASHHDETVMRAPRTWAARATTDETAPCAMTRGSDPVETHRRSRWYYGLSSAVDTGGRLLCNRFGHAPPE